MTPPRRVLVALATYNEIENLPSLVEAIEHELPQADLLVVDDNSPDGTGRWCDERATSDSRLHVLHREGKLGLGSATVAAFRFALDNGYDVVATLDADWSHPPEVLPKLLEMTETVGVAIGSRYCAGGAIEGWPWSRRIVSAVMNRVTRWLLRIPVRDASGAFRAYRGDALQSIDLSSLRATGYAYLEEILWRLHHTGVTFDEAPIAFRDRTAGQSKIGLGELVGKLRMLFYCSVQRP